WGAGTRGRCWAATPTGSARPGAAAARPTPPDPGFVGPRGGGGYCALMPAATDTRASREARSGTSADRGRLVVASFLMLFVELALIRGTAADVVYLSFFMNLVLLASFLGFGVGFLRAGRIIGAFYLGECLSTALMV